MNKTYFFSFGDDNYKNSKIRIAQEAKNFGFDYIDIFGPNDISKEFIEKTQPYIDMPRGKGYWLWKSFFLKEIFNKMDEGDFCVYCDAGCSINPHAKETFEEYKRLLNESDSGIIRFSFEKTPEQMFCNDKVFEYFGKNDDEDFKNSDCLMATMLIFKKCENSIKFINDYYKVATEAPVLFSDEYNQYHCDKFKDHRHDQSVSSILAKLNGNIIILDDNSYAPDHDGWINLVFVKKIPFLATRIRG